MLKKLSDIFEFNKEGKSQKGNYKATESFNFLALIHKWPEVVGPKLSEVTIPLKNHHNTLTILTQHPAYSQSLSFLEETLKEKIYKTFPMLRGKINKFYFKVSTEHFEQERDQLLSRSQMWSKGHQIKEKDSPKQKVMHQYNPQVRALKQEALAQFSDVDDQEMQELLINLYIQTKI